MLTHHLVGSKSVFLHPRVSAFPINSVEAEGCENHVEGNPHLAVAQNQWYHFGVGAPPILEYFSGDSDVHRGYGLSTHGHFLLFPKDT